MDAVVARRILEALDDNGGIVDGPFGLSFDKYAPSTVLVYSALNIAVNACTIQAYLDMYKYKCHTAIL